MLDGVHVYSLLDSATQTEGEELLRNGGFEETTGSGRPIHWLAEGKGIAIGEIERIPRGNKSLDELMDQLEQLSEDDLKLMLDES